LIKVCSPKVNQGMTRDRYWNFVALVNGVITYLCIFLSYGMFLWQKGESDFLLVVAMYREKLSDRYSCETCHVIGCKISSEKDVIKIK